MDKPKLKRYSNPIDPVIGKKYFVPCVTKNKDSLIYYIMGVNNCAEGVLSQMPPDSTIKTNLHLNSLRFNDVLPDGKKIHELTKEDYDEMGKDAEARANEFHPDNQVKIEEPFFNIVCPNCGNSYIFKRPQEIPEETFFCGLCERVLIDYTESDDWEFEYYEE